MYKAAVLLASLLVPIAATRAPAQTDGGASSTPPSAQQQAQVRRPRVYTGLQIQFSASITAERVATNHYPVVAAVEPGSPGNTAGVLPGDLITEVNGRDSREDRALWLEPGVRYTLRVRTGDQEREVILVPLPPRTPATPPAS